jgi:hypothetical protein
MLTGPGDWPSLKPREGGSDNDGDAGWGWRCIAEDLIHTQNQYSRATEKVHFTWKWSGSAPAPLLADS